MRREVNSTESELRQGEPAPAFGPRVAEEGLVEMRIDGRAQVSVSADELLRRLIGQPLETASGRANRILDVVDGAAIVQTDRSPAGQPVPVRWVQSALENLWTSGEVVIHPESVGYRSAFIGAVLRTLPRATIGGSPPMVRLERAAPVFTAP